MATTTQIAEAFALGAGMDLATVMKCARSLREGGYLPAGKGGRSGSGGAEMEGVHCANLLLGLCSPAPSSPIAFLRRIEALPFNSVSQTARVPGASQKTRIEMPGAEETFRGSLKAVLSQVFSPGGWNPLLCPAGISIKEHGPMTEAVLYLMLGTGPEAQSRIEVGFGLDHGPAHWSATAEAYALTRRTVTVELIHPTLEIAFNLMNAGHPKAVRDLLALERQRMSPAGIAQAAQSVAQQYDSTLAEH